jgi:hypothetical protein
MTNQFFVAGSPPFSTSTDFKYPQINFETINNKMSDVKTVNISGDAAKELTGGKRTRRNTKKAQAGGAEEAVRGVAPVMANVKGVESASPLAATAASPNSTTWLKYPGGALTPSPSVITPSHTPAPNQAAAPTNQYAVPTAQQQGGSNKQVKVELRKKAATKKVHLQPKKAEAPKAPLLKKNHTRKIRKITMGVSSLKKRLTRAKKLHKDIKSMSDEKLKEKLVKGGLIKANSKAPANVLRQIASDAEIIRNKAL